MPVYLPSMEDSDMVALIDAALDRLAKSHTTISALADLTRDTESASTISETHIDSMQVIRRSLTERCVSAEAANIIMCSWRPSTKKQYNTVIQKWFLFCHKKQVDSVQISLSNVLDFLTSLYHDGLGYSAINTARSALSAIGIILEGFSAGSHPLVIRFLKGIYNLRPSVPRYKETWDVSVVLQYLLSLSPADSLTLKNLSLKLVMLYCINSSV